MQEEHSEHKKIFDREEDNSDDPFCALAFYADEGCLECIRKIELDVQYKSHLTNDFDKLQIPLYENRISKFPLKCGYSLCMVGLYHHRFSESGYHNERALDCFRRSAEQGNSLAMKLLGDECRKDRVEWVHYSREEMEYYLAGFRAGSHLCVESMAHCYREIDPIKSMHCYKMTSKVGYRFSAVEISNDYYGNDGTPTSHIDRWENFIKMYKYVKLIDDWDFHCIGEENLLSIVDLSNSSLTNYHQMLEFCSFMHTYMSTQTRADIPLHFGPLTEDYRQSMLWQNPIVYKQKIQSLAMHIGALYIGETDV